MVIVSSLQFLCFLFLYTNRCIKGRKQTVINNNSQSSSMSNDDEPPPQNLATLWVHGPDSHGIVAGFSQLLYGHGCGILDSEQSTDRAANLFFQRIHFDYSQMHTDRITLEKGIHDNPDGGWTISTWSVSLPTIMGGCDLCIWLPCKSWYKNCTLASIPKPLKFLRPHYPLLKVMYELAGTIAKSTTHNQGQGGITRSRMSQPCYDRYDPYDEES